MKSLARLIGPAPSEQPFETFLEKVVLERDRVRRNLIWFQSHGPSNRPKKKAAKKKTPKLATLAKKSGLSPEAIAKAIAQLKKEKEENS